MNAIEKLTKGTKGNNDMKVIADYLKERAEEDKGFAEDVMNPQKTMEKCYEYIVRKAKEQAENSKNKNMAVVRSDIVFEWAEDYFRMIEPDEDDEPVVKPKKKATPTKSLMDMLAEQMDEPADEEEEECEDFEDDEDEDDEEPKQLTLMDILANSDDEDEEEYEEEYEDDEEYEEEDEEEDDADDDDCLAFM